MYVSAIVVFAAHAVGVSEVHADPIQNIALQHAEPRIKISFGLGYSLSFRFGNRGRTGRSKGRLAASACPVSFRAGRLLAQPLGGSRSSRTKSSGTPTRNASGSRRGHTAHRPGPSRCPTSRWPFENVHSGPTMLRRATNLTRWLVNINFPRGTTGGACRPADESRRCNTNTPAAWRASVPAAQHSFHRTRRWRAGEFSVRPHPRPSASSAAYPSMCG